MLKVYPKTDAQSPALVDYLAVTRQLNASHLLHRKQRNAIMDRLDKLQLTEIEYRELYYEAMAELDKKIDDLSSNWLKKKALAFPVKKREKLKCNA